MFIVSWEDDPPDDRDDWIRLAREVLAGASGSFVVRFSRVAAGWSFDLAVRTDLGEQPEGVLANTLEGVRFNLRHALKKSGKPLAPEGREDASQLAD